MTSESRVCTRVLVSPCGVVFQAVLWRGAQEGGGEDPNPLDVPHVHSRGHSSRAGLSPHSRREAPLGSQGREEVCVWGGGEGYGVWSIVELTGMGP